MPILKSHRTALIKTALLLFAFFPLIPNRIKGLPVIFLAVISLNYFSLKKSKIKYFLGYSFLFILYFISLSYTSNVSYGLKELETSLSILIIPFIFFLLLSKKYLTDDLQFSFIKNFIISSTIFSLISFFFIVIDPHPFYKDFYTDKFRLVVTHIPLLGQHPIYASIFLALAIIFNIFYFNKLFKQKKWTVFSLTINIILLLMLSSRGVIVALFIIFLFLVFLKFNFQLKTKLFLLFFILTSLIMLFTFNRRMHELIIPKTYNTVNSNYSHSFRIAINHCSLNLIKKNFFGGYGVGDVQDKLNECYNNTSKLLLEKTYNSHNQYLDIWLKTGIIGFIYFVYFIFYLLIRSFKNKNYLLFSIIILYGINFFFENLLVRQSGVILFYFLISFLTLKNLNENYEQ